MIRRIIQNHKRKAEAALFPQKKAILGDCRMVGVDVGSATGMQPHWQAYEGIVDLYLFEPHAESFEALKASFSRHPHARKFHIVPVALSGSGGERTLHVLNCPTGSSLYPVDDASEFADLSDPYIFPIRETRTQTRRLSDVLDDEGVEAIDIMKLDVQGAELEILQGAGDERRKKLLLVESEINVSGGVSRNLSIYRHTPTWTQIDELLVADGLRLLDLSVARSYRGRGGDFDWYQRKVFDVYENTTSLAAHAWEVDAVYVRDWRLLIADRDLESIRKLALALCGYRFFSEAYFLIEKAEEVRILDESAASLIKNAIVSWHGTYRHFWHGRGALAKQLRRTLSAAGVSQLKRWKQYMWFDYPNG